MAVDLAAYEDANNPDGVEPPDSNPVGTTTWRGRTLIADAGANTVVSVEVRRGVHSRGVAGRRSRSAAMPRAASGYEDPVPAGADVGRGRSGRRGLRQPADRIPFPSGGSSIYRVPRGGGEPQVWATGLTNVTDLTWTGARCTPSNCPTMVCSTSPRASCPAARSCGFRRVDCTRRRRGRVTAPYGVAIRDGHAYVTTCAVCAGDGQVLRVPLRRYDRRRTAQT